MIRIPVTVCFLCLAVAPADQRPNFTGTWKQVGSPERSYIDTIEHRDPNLKVATHISDTPLPSTLQRPTAALFFEKTYSTDGTEQVSQRRQRWTTVYWQGSALIFLIVDKKDCHVTVTRETWTLSDAGKTLTRNRRVVGPEGLSQEKSVFEKQ